jgi:hypothetical protein
LTCYHRRPLDTVGASSLFVFVSCCMHIHAQCKVIPEGMREEDALEATTKLGKLEQPRRALTASSTRMCPPRHQKTLSVCEPSLFTSTYQPPLSVEPRLWTHHRPPIGKDFYTGLRSGTPFAIFLRASLHLPEQGNELLRLWVAILMRMRFWMRHASSSM